MEGPITSVQLVDLINLLRALNIANIRNVYTSEEVPRIERLWNKMMYIVRSNGVEDIYCDLNNKDSDDDDDATVVKRVEELTVEENNCEGGVCKIKSDKSCCKDDSC